MMMMMMMMWQWRNSDSVMMIAWGLQCDDNDDGEYDDNQNSCSQDLPHDDNQDGFFFQNLPPSNPAKAPQSQQSLRILVMFVDLCLFMSLWSSKNKYIYISPQSLGRKKVKIPIFPSFMVKNEKKKHTHTWCGGFSGFDVLSSFSSLPFLDLVFHISLCILTFWSLKVAHRMRL